MLPQLLLSKRLFLEGCEFARRPDAVSCGLAISLFQDSVEIYIWALVKDRSILVKDTFTFTGNIEAVEKAGITVPDRPKLLELNKARISFKHYGNLPAPDEARKFRIYTEDFLKAAAKEHFSLDFNQISLVDLVAFADVREHLKIAQAKLIEDDAKAAVRELSISKVLLFRNLDKHIPKVDHNLKDIDRLLSRTPELRGVKGFSYIAQYMDVLREISMITLLQVPIADYTFLRANLMNANQFGSGEWQTVDTRLQELPAEDCRRMISISLK